MLNNKNNIEINEFRKNGHKLVDWIANYFENIEDYPVLSKVKPGDIKKNLPKFPPNKSEQVSDIFEYLDKIIMPGITHWNYPNFMAYFNLYIF